MFPMGGVREVVSIEAYGMCFQWRAVGWCFRCRAWGHVLSGNVGEVTPLRGNNRKRRKRSEDEKRKKGGERGEEAWENVRLLGNTQRTGSFPRGRLTLELKR